MAKAKEQEKTSTDEAKSEGEAPQPKRRFSKEMILIAAGTLMLLLGGGAGAYFFLMGGEAEHAAVEDGHGDAHAPAEHKSGDAHAPDKASAHGADHGDKHASDAAHGEAAGHPTFFDLPAILVNLRAQDKQNFLKLTISLEVKNAETVKTIEAVMPRVVDQFQTFLRELRVEDLSGSEATFRLKEELLRRVNLAAAPARIEDVLFKEMIVQ